jgi:hypothetical protein
VDAFFLPAGESGRLRFMDLKDMSPTVEVDFSVI